jgi:hypothetical protein
MSNILELNPSEPPFSLSVPEGYRPVSTGIGVRGDARSKKDRNGEAGLGIATFA